MTYGWSGSDPSPIDDAGQSYELSTEFEANDNITITGVRVWANQTQSFTNRNARLWNSGGTVQRTIDIDDSLPTTGWTEYDLVSPLDVAQGETFYVSYATTRYYGAISGGYPRDSSDSAVTATSGFFIPTPNNFPDQASSSFYGIDIIYELQGGNQAPEIALSVQQSDLDVVLAISVTDEFPGAVTNRIVWGDGTTTNLSAGVTSSSHTYPQAGLYAILVTATDSGGLTGSSAIPVSLTYSPAATSDEEWISDILDAVMSDVQMSNYFKSVNSVEPKRAPNTEMTAAIWVVSVDPIALASGLAATSARLVFNLRMYQNMLSKPEDMIDPRMTKALSNIMRRYHDNYDFDGIIRNVDVFGQYGVALSAQSGYLEVDKINYRIIDLTIPCIVNDVWTQS